MIDQAYDGEMDSLQAYFKKYQDFSHVDRRKNWTSTDWDREMPSWYGKNAKRGLKFLKSRTSRGKWDIRVLCAQCTKKSITAWMETIAMPPVVEEVEEGEEVE